jgi:large subunit ribosomal protein L15
MRLHDLQRRSPNKKRKPRVGRGGKRGDYSGRGVKGQRARAGHRIRPAERDYIQRLPKLRGHKNARKSIPMPVINVGDLEKLIGDKKIITSKFFGANTKILSKGTISKPITVIGLPVSAVARKKIEDAGGVVKTLSVKKVASRVKKVKKNKK